MGLHILYNITVKLLKSLGKKSDHHKIELYYQIFAQGQRSLSLGNEIGKLKRFKYTISLKSDKIFIKDSYRMSPVRKEILKDMIQQYKDNDVLIGSISVY